MLAAKDYPETSPEAARIRLALELSDMIIDITRERFTRENPDATPAEIEGLVLAWLQAPSEPDRRQLPGWGRYRPASGSQQ